MRNYYRVFVVTVIIITIYSVHALGQFAGGSGTAEDPWVIETAEQLDNVRDYLQDHFILAQDIDLGVPPWNEETGWQGIGTVSGNVHDFDESEAFNGHFNGNGYTIENLTMNFSVPGQSGFFAFLGGDAIVENLNINNMDAAGMAPIGGVAAYNGGVIRYVMVQGNLEGNQSNTGGIVGVNDGLVRHAIAHVSIQANTNVGGIVGLNRSGAQVRNTYSSSDIVNGMNFLGGLIGNNAGMLSYSYTTGFVNSQIANFYGEITGNNTGTVTNCYFNTLAYPDAPERGGQGLSNEEMRDPANFESWDFEEVWGLQEGVTYPFLLQVEGDSPSKTDLIIEVFPENVGSPTGAGGYQFGAYAELAAEANDGYMFQHWKNEQGEILGDEESLVYRMFNEPVTIQAYYSSLFAGGSGTEADPWQIGNVEQFDNMRNYLGLYHDDKHFIQTAHINFEGLSIEPVGHFSGEGFIPFRGTYDGGHYSISGFSISFPEDRHIGLFAFVDGGEIRNLTVKESFVEGHMSVGAIAGSAPFGKITNCRSVDNQIKGRQGVGGIVGTAGIEYDPNLFIKYSASIDNEIVGDFYVGGIAGTARGTRIQYCYSTSSVSGTDIANHPNMGSRSFVGGIAGHNSWGGEIIDCYSIGPLTAADENPAGISAFYSWYGAFISGSYWDMEATGTDYTYGSGAGRITSDMTYPYAANTFANWDFDTIWSHDEDHSVNSGYPHLDFSLPTSTENEEDVPRQVKLHQNYPNPFNPVTNISYELPERQEVKLEVYNVLGRRVAILASGSQPAGSHVVQFDASRLASGVYLYRLQAGNVVQTQKMMLIK